jgi:TetR/AcrR family transcriptional regulator, mexJK operon transcriptional repressor
MDGSQSAELGLDKKSLALLRRSRPPRGNTRDVLLSVARTLFLAAGFAGTSMDSIVAMARISKATAYAHFRSKAELYRAAVQTHAPALLGPALTPNGSIEETLVDFGRSFLREVLSPAHVANLRALAHDRSRFPDLGTDLFAKAYGEPLRQLERYLEAADMAGWLNTPSARAGAQHLVGLLLGLAQVSILLGGAQPNSVELDEKVHDAIAAFWKLYSASPGAAEKTQSSPRCITLVDRSSIHV